MSGCELVLLAADRRQLWFWGDQFSAQVASPVPLNELVLALPVPGSRLGAVAGCSSWERRVPRGCLPSRSGQSECGRPPCPQPNVETYLFVDIIVSPALVIGDTLVASWWCGGEDDYWSHAGPGRV